MEPGNRKQETGNGERTENGRKRDGLELRPGSVTLSGEKEREPAHARVHRQSRITGRGNPPPRSADGRRESPSASHLSQLRGAAAAAVCAAPAHGGALLERA